MRLAWLTDIHLNFVGQKEIEALCGTIRSTGVDAVLLTGDIATSSMLTTHLKDLAQEIDRPIYFVLGNHDYYGSSIEKVKSEVSLVVNACPELVWLSQAGPVALTSDTCLIGHEGWADGRLGDSLGSTVELNDYVYIEELRQPTRKLRLQRQNQLGDAAAHHLQKQLDYVIGTYKKIIVALHVPPFQEACWHLGKISDDSFLPHFSCKATGEVLRTTMEKHPEITLTVYCGHTHSQGYVEILPNLHVFTGGAEYRYPCITDIIQV